MPAGGPQDIPIQPVNKPILCSPYTEPTDYWVYDTRTGEASRFPGRRPATGFKPRRTNGGTLMLRGFAGEERNGLRRVNCLRA